MTSVSIHTLFLSPVASGQRAGSFPAGAGIAPQPRPMQQKHITLDGARLALVPPDPELISDWNMPTKIVRLPVPKKWQPDPVGTKQLPSVAPGQRKCPRCGGSLIGEKGVALSPLPKSRFQGMGQRTSFAPSKAAQIKVRSKRKVKHANNTNGLRWLRKMFGATVPARPKC